MFVLQNWIEFSFSLQLKLFAKIGRRGKKLQAIQNHYPAIQFLHVPKMLFLLITRLYAFLRPILLRKSIFCLYILLLLSQNTSVILLFFFPLVFQIVFGSFFKDFEERKNALRWNRRLRRVSWTQINSFFYLILFFLFLVVELLLNIKFI